MRKRSQLQLCESQSMGEFRTLKKSNSCSTIYIDDSTVSNPNLKNTIKCVSLAVYYLIKNRKNNTLPEIFDEKLHPLTVRHYFPPSSILFLSLLPFYGASSLKSLYSWPVDIFIIGIDAQVYRKFCAIDIITLLELGCRIGL